MTVRFIFGRSGTGKTHHCVESVRGELQAAAEGPPLILLVPEQASFQIERALIAGEKGDIPVFRRSGLVESAGRQLFQEHEPEATGGRKTGVSPFSHFGYHRARVLSFRRFAHELFNELGGPAFPPISPLAKQMVLRAVLEPMRERLTTFAASLDRPGFLARLAEMFREFHQYQVSSTLLRERAAAEPRARLKRKLLELAEAFDAFNAYLREAKFTDPDAALTLAAERVERSGLARGARVWIDGFAGFTPQELAFLGELAVAAERVEIALVLDPEEVPQWTAAGAPSDVPAGRLFRRTEQTYLRLRRLLADKGVAVEKPRALQTVRRFAAASRLSEIERELFAASPSFRETAKRAAVVGGGGEAAKRTPAGGGANIDVCSDAAKLALRDAKGRFPDALTGTSQTGALTGTLQTDALTSTLRTAASLLAHRDDELLLVEAPDRRGEVRAAAGHIRHLVGRCGYRYRDIAVILRSLDEYWQFIVEAFADAGIPFFIDRRQPVSHHPLIELLRSAVGTVARRVASADVIAFLKTDLPAGALPEEKGSEAISGNAAGTARVAAYRDAVDRLENYALAYGLAGAAWFSPGQWRYHESTAFGEENLASQPPPAGMDEIIRVASECLAPLAELHREVASAEGKLPVRQWAAALWRMLTRLNVQPTLEAWAAEEAREGEAHCGGGPFTRARPRATTIERVAPTNGVHRQVLAAVTDLLGDLSRSLGETAMDAGQFAAVLEAGLSQLTLGLVPPALDQVLVGAIERSRHPDIKAAVVLGMAERSFPRLHGVQSILNEEDRAALAGTVDETARGREGEGEEEDARTRGRGDAGTEEEQGAKGKNAGTGETDAARLRFRETEADNEVPTGRVPDRRIELAPGRGDLLFDEDMLAYLALTRPSERLWVSFPAADDAGKPVNPSRYFRRLRGRFADAPLARLADQDPALTALTPAELAGGLAGRFAACDAPQVPPLDAALYELVRSAAPQPLARTLASLAYANAPTLSADLARRLLAPRGLLAGSVTRLETFAACPFKHFATFGLSLRPREQIELDALQLGSFYHELLRELFERLGPPPVSWAARPVGHLRQVVAELVSAARDRLALPSLAGGAAGYVLAQAEGVLGDLAEAMHAAAAAAPTVRQAAAELMFGLRDDGSLPPLRLTLPDGVELAVRGKIDRIDLADDGGLFVIDYKTGPNAVNWSKVHHGLSLQLMTYLLVVEQDLREKGTGSFFAAVGEKRACPLFPEQPEVGKKGTVPFSKTAGNGASPLFPAGAFFQRIVVPPAAQDPPASDAPAPDPDEIYLGYQRRGLFLADEAKALDNRLAAGRSSVFVKIKLNKDATPSANASDAVTAAQLAGLMNWTADWMKRLGAGVVAGDVAVRPYRLGNDSPCSWCEFRRVCRLDFDYNRPRYLDPWKRKAVLAEVVE